MFILAVRCARHNNNHNNYNLVLADVIRAAAMFGKNKSACSLFVFVMSCFIHYCLDCDFIFFFYFKDSRTVSMVHICP